MYFAKKEEGGGGTQAAKLQSQRQQENTVPCDPPEADSGCRRFAVRVRPATFRWSGKWRNDWKKNHPCNPCNPRELLVMVLLSLSFLVLDFGVAVDLASS